MQHLPVKTHFLLQVGIQVANQEIEKLGRETQRLHLLVKTQCFVQLGISCELRNRKMGRETDRRHLLVKRQCSAQFGIRSTACRVMFPQQSLETKRCENIRERDIRWTKYSNPATRTMLNALTPNLNVSARLLPKVMLGVWFLSSIGANALQVTLTLNFGGEGVVPDRRGLNISSIYSSGTRASSTAFSETPKFEESMLHSATNLEVSALQIASAT